MITTVTGETMESARECRKAIAEIGALLERVNMLSSIYDKDTQKRICNVIGNVGVLDLTFSCRVSNDARTSCRVA